MAKASLSKRTHILATAIRLFNKKGISPVTMDEIAAAVPVSKMTIYKYFGSREQLIEAAIAEILDRLITRFKEVVDGAPTFTDKIKSVTEYQFGEDESFSSTLSFDLLNHYPEQIKKMLSAYEQQVEPVLEDMIYNAQREGYVRKDVSVHVIVAFIKMVKAFFARPERFKDVGDMEIVLSQVREIVYHGILI